MFPYSSRGGRQRNVSAASQSANSLEYAVHQDLQTIVLPLYIQRLREQIEIKEARAFSCFTNVFQSTQLALLLRYPAHWKPHGTKALYGCVPVRCNPSSFVQWIYSIVAHRILAVYKSQSVHDSAQSFTSNESFWSEMSLYVFALYAFHEIATVPPKPPFDGQSTNGDDDDKREREEKRLRAYLPMGLQSNENPKMLYRRSFPESNRIRCTVELYSTLMQLQNMCYMLGPLSQRSDGRRILAQWIAYDLAEIVQRLLDPHEDRLEFCAYLGPCSLESFAASGEHQVSTHSNETAMKTSSVVGPEVANFDRTHEDIGEPMDATATTIDTTHHTNDDDSNDASVVVQDLLHEYIELRQQCLLESPTVAEPSSPVRNDPKPRRRVRARMASSVPAVPPHVDASLQNAPTTVVDPMVQLLRWYSDQPTYEHPADPQAFAADASPSDETDDDREVAIGTTVMHRDEALGVWVPPVTRVPVSTIQDDEQSMVSTWTNGTAVGVGQSALRQLLSQVGPTAAQNPPAGRSMVASNIYPQEYGDFFLNQGASSSANGYVSRSDIGNRKAKGKSRMNTAKRKAINRPEIDIEQSDASVASLLSFWSEPDVGQHSHTEAAFTDEDSSSRNSFSLSSSNSDDAARLRHPTTGRMALSTLLSLAGVGKSDENDNDDPDL
jgi:hypothetical protein